MKIGILPTSIIMMPATFQRIIVSSDAHKDLVLSSQQAREPFGTVYAHNGQMAPMGCCSDVREVEKDVTTGSLNVEVSGSRRFRILDISMGNKGYEVATVEYRDDWPQLVDEDLTEECIAVYNDIVDAVFGDDSSDVGRDDPGIPYPLSYALVPKIGMTPDQKIHLMQMDDEEERLKYVLTHMNSVLPTVNTALTVRRVIVNDGYLPPKKKSTDE